MIKAKDRNTTRRRIAHLIFQALLLTTIGFFSACNSTSADNQFTANGKVFSAFFGDTVGVLPQSMTIGEKEITSFMGGTFEVELLPGEYNVVILAPNHSRFEETVRITDPDSLLEFEVKPNMVDYYAPRVGNKWEFELINSSGSESRPPEEKVTGIMKWEIIRDSLSTSTGDSIFIVQNYFEGESYYFNPFRGEEPEITAIKDTSEFFIKLNSDISVTYSAIEHLDKSFSTFAYHYQFPNSNNIGYLKKAVRRYPYSWTQGNPIRVNLAELGNEYYFLEVGIGITEYMDKPGGHTPFLKSLKLKSFEKGS